MTVSTLVSSVSYVGNGVSTIFTYPFYIIDAAHLQVWVNGALLPVNVYIINSVGNQFGGEVRLNVAPLTGQQIDIKRSVPPTQLVDYRPYDPFPAETHEQALDKLTMIVQGNTGGIANAVRAPYLEPVGATNLVLPGAATRANQVLGFDLSGNVMLYPFVGVPPYGISDHGQLSGLADDDHPQYALRTDLANTYLPLTGGTMTGAIQLPPGFPALSTEAVSKAYVDTFTGSVLTKNIVSDATGDAQGTVQNAWNAQANSLAVTRASNEIVYYRWKSTDTSVFRYVGSQQGPVAWATTAADWVSAAGVTEAPQDGLIYGRTGATWAEVVARSGGGYLGKVQGFAGAAAPADLARTDEAQALADAAVDAHEALLDPHPQYPLKADIVGTVVQDPQPVGMKQGQQWYESDTGGYYMRYVNPDATETLVSLAGAGGDFIGMAARGVANGVASLDAGVKVPVAQLPDLSGTYLTPGVAASTYVPLSQKGAANGVASLDGATRVPVAQIPDLSATYRLLANATFSVPVLHADGTQAAPGISWASDSSTGFYANAPGTVIGVSGGGWKWYFTATQFNVGVQANFSDGTLAAPGIAWAGSTNSGFRHIGGGGVQYIVGGVAKLAQTDTVFNVVTNAVFNGTLEVATNVGLPAVTFTNTASSGSGIRLNLANSPKNQTLVFLISHDNLFQVWTNTGIYNNAAANASWSDARMKRDIVPSPDHTAFVEKLQYREFSFESDPGYRTDDVIAQELSELDPKLVTDVDGTLGVYTHRLQQRINSVVPRLLTRIKALEEKLAALEKK